MRDTMPRRERGEYRPIYERLLDGPAFQELTPAARLVLIACKLKCGAAGIRVLPGLREALTEWTGLSSREISRALAQLENDGWVRVERSVVWIVRGLEFEPSMDASNPKQRTHVQRLVEALPSVTLVEDYRAHYTEWFSVTHQAPTPTPDESASDTPPDRVSDSQPEGYGIGTRSTSTSTNTTTQPSSTGARVLRVVGDDPPPDPVDAFLGALPPTRRLAWQHTIDGWRQGVGYIAGRSAADADIAQGVTEYLASSPTPDFAPAHVVQFVRRAEERRTKPPKAEKPTSFWEVA